MESSRASIKVWMALAALTLSLSSSSSVSVDPHTALCKSHMNSVLSPVPDMMESYYKRWMTVCRKSLRPYSIDPVTLNRLARSPNAKAIVCGMLRVRFDNTCQTAVSGLDDVACSLVIDQQSILGCLGDD